MRRRYETLLRTNITVEDHGGDGELVVFVHGLGGSAGNWSLVAPQVAEHARAVAMDLPGHGRSGPAPRHDLDTHLATVTALIERLAPGPATVVGNSMGGLISELLASTRPDLVAGLVLLAPATPPRSLRVPDVAIAARLALQSAPVVGPLASAAITQRLSPREQVEETLRIVMHRPDRLPEDVWRRAVDLASLRRTMPWATRAFAESAASLRRTLLDRAAYARAIDAITAPTTMVFGTCDRVVPPEALRWLAARRPDWRSMELGDTGHTPMLERPDIVAREILRRLPVPTA